MRVRSPSSRRANTSGWMFAKPSTPETVIDIEALSFKGGSERRKLFPETFSRSTSIKQPVPATISTRALSSACSEKTVSSEDSRYEVTNRLDRKSSDSRNSKKNKLKSFGQKQYLRAAETFVAIEKKAEERSSKVAKKVMAKIQKLVSKQPKHQEILTTTTQDTVEISLQSPPRSREQTDKKFKNLETCKQVAVKQYSKAAGKLSSIVHRPQHRRTLSHPQDCPICVGPMSEADMAHPLHCATPHCHFNFCAPCIQSIIKSSEDEYMEASDGSRQVKVFLQCPNCRDDLSKSIRHTLILRTADMKLSPSVRNSLLLHLMHRRQSDSVPPSKVASMNLDAIETEICKARVQEREFFKTKPPPQAEREERLVSREQENPSRRKLFKKFQQLGALYGRYNVALNPIEYLPSNTRRLGSSEAPPTRKTTSEQAARRSDMDDNNSIRSPMPLVHDQSFNMNQASCFYIDTHVNFGGLNPRLRFQL